MGDNRNAPCFCGSGKKYKKCHPDIVYDSAFAELITLYNKINERIANNTNFEKLKCGRGCAECCYQNFSVWPIEFYYILYMIHSTAGIEKVYQYIEKGYNMWLNYENTYPDLANKLRANAEEKDLKFIYDLMEKSNLDNNFPCPFLNVSEGTCEVYDARPLICREYAVSYRKKYNYPISFCSNTMYTIDYEEYMTDISDINSDCLMKFYSEKFKVSATDRPYPIFYFCKIAYLNKDNLLNKINEMKNISKTQYIDQKFERLLKRKK